MKRVAAVFLMLLSLSACAARERPEGIVERWLLALNQGSAGRPDRFAPGRISERVLPGWRHLVPGEFDVIDVQPAAIRRCSEATGDPTCTAGERIATVPFDVENVRGVAARFEVDLVDRGAGWHVTSLATNEHPMTLREEGWPSRLGSLSWLLAIAVGAVLLIIAEGAMRLVRRRVTGWSLRDAGTGGVEGGGGP